MWPINKIPLWVFFEIAEWLLTSFIKLDHERTPEANPILKGNFVSCKHESSYEILDIVSGNVPDDINGIFLRNGPNFKNMNESKRVHWFDGDSMIHSFRIKNGKIFYCNRYTQTPRQLMETKLEKAVFPRIGEMFKIAGLIKMGLY